MINKNIEDITVKDFEDLILNSVKESKTIEYKLLLPGGTDADKKEFLADISSFANTSGGDLIFGIDEADGCPTQLTGLVNLNTDKELLKLEHIIRDGIEPRVPIIIKPYTLDNGNSLILCRIAKSWQSPHRVIFAGHDKFYGRNSAGKYPFNTGELRSAFNLSLTLSEKIKNFQSDRIMQIYSGNTPLPMYETAKIVLHLLPLQSFSQEITLSLSQMKNMIERLSPIYSSGWNNRPNLDGLLTYSGSSSGKSYGYNQLYRNGVIEAVDALILMPRDDRKFIPSQTYEERLLQALKRFLGVYKTLSIEPPLIIYLTLMGVDGYELAVDSRTRFLTEHYPINRDILLLPETIIDNIDADEKEILKPMFDLIWNCCGYERSLNFDNQGNWVTR